MRDLMNTISAVHVLGNGALITATTHGTAVDVTSLNDGNDGLCFVVDVGAVTDGTHTLSVEDSIDGGSTWQAVAAPYLQTPSGQSNVVNSGTTAGTILKYGYLGNPNVGTLANSTLSGAPSQKIKVRMSNTVTGSPATGGYIDITAVLGYPFSEPTA